MPPNKEAAGPKTCRPIRLFGKELQLAQQNTLPIGLGFSPQAVSLIGGGNMTECIALFRLHLNIDSHFDARPRWRQPCLASKCICILSLSGCIVRMPSSFPSLSVLNHVRGGRGARWNHEFARRETADLGTDAVVPEGVRVRQVCFIPASHTATTRGLGWRRRAR